MLPLPVLPRALSVVLLLVAPLGCVPTKVDETNDAPAVDEATLNASGGTLSAGNTELWVPEGALDPEARVDVTLAELTAAPVPLPFERERISPIVKVTPHGTTFLSALQLSTWIDRKLSDSDDIALYRLADDDARWERLGADEARLELDGDNARFKTDRFSYYAVTVPHTSCASLLPASACNGSPGPSCVSSWECRTGEVVTMAPEARCPSCAPAPAEESCEDATAGLDAMMEQMITRGCMATCQTDDECTAFRVESACADRCYALYGLLDEEPLLAAVAYAEDHCGACGSTAARAVYVGGGSCVEGQCWFPEALSEASGEVWVSGGSD